MLTLIKTKLRQSRSRNISFKQRDLMTKMFKDKGGYYIMIKRLILQEELTILNVYVPNNNKKSKLCEAKTVRTERRNE